MNDVYLDGHATTPAAPEVIAAMQPWWGARAGNSHSPHRRGLLANAAVEQARLQIATLIGAAAQEIVFTSGATESNNLAIIGTFEAALAAAIPRRKIIVSALEHKSVLAAAEACRRQGAIIEIVPALPNGLVDLDALTEL